MVTSHVAQQPHKKAYLNDTFDTAGRHFREFVGARQVFVQGNVHLESLRGTRCFGHHVLHTSMAAIAAAASRPMMILVATGRRFGRPPTTGTPMTLGRSPAADIILGSRRILLEKR